MADNRTITNRKYGDEIIMNLVESRVKKIALFGMAAIFLLALSACTPEIGSDKWCKNMNEKAKSDWTVSEATDYAKHCLLK